LREEIEHLVGHAVGPRRDRQPGDAGKVERLAVEARQFFRRPVGVGVALEIGDEFLRAVAARERRRALRELLGDGSSGAEALRRVARVVAVDAAAHGDAAVAVGTGEIHADADLVNARVKSILERPVERVVALAAPAAGEMRWKVHGAEVKKTLTERAARLKKR